MSPSACRSNRPSVRLVSTLAALASVPSVACAQSTFLWNPERIAFSPGTPASGGAGTWSATADLWRPNAGGTMITGPGATNIAEFGPFTSPYRSTVTLSDPQSVAGVKFSFYGYDLTGAGTLTLGSSGVSVTTNIGYVLIATPLALSANATVSTAGTTALSLDGALNLGTRTASISTASADGSIYLRGSISGTGGLTLTGPGSIHLTAADRTYTGATRIGYLDTTTHVYLADGASLPATSNVRFFNGIIHANDSFTAALGTTAGKIQWDSLSAVQGGFSAIDRTLHVNLGGAGATITVGATGLNSFEGSDIGLALSSTTATAATIFDNPIAIGTLGGPGGSTGLNVNVADNPNSTADYARLAGALSSFGSLTKSGNGYLEVADATALSGAISTQGGRLYLESALNGNTTRVSNDAELQAHGIAGLSSGSATSGGFYTARGGALQLGAAGATFTWTNSSGPTYLGLLRYDAASTLDVAANLNLGGSTRQIDVQAFYTTGAAAEVTLSGAVSNGVLYKTGDGSLVLQNLSNANFGVAVAGGVLGFRNVYDTGTGAYRTSVPFETNKMYLAGGTFEYVADAPSTYTSLSFVTEDNNPYGTPTLLWLGDGGFSARGGPLRVTIFDNTTHFGAPVWGATPGFLGNGDRLLFGSDQATDQTIWTNAINLGGAARTIHVTDNPDSATDVGILAGTISNGALTKTGDGTLWLQDASYTGATRIEDGVLRVGREITTTTGGFNPTLLSRSYADTLPTGSNVVLAGGILEQAYSGSYGTQRTFYAPGNYYYYTSTGPYNLPFTQAVGTGAGEIEWQGDGGFSAFTGNVTVNLFNDARTLVWGTTPSFLGDGDRLLLGAAGSTGSVTWTNPLDLGGGTRTIVADGTGVQWVSGLISNGALVKDGPGSLILTAANPYAGGTTVTGGRLVALATNALGSGIITLQDGTDLGGNVTIANPIELVGSSARLSNGGSTTGVISGPGHLELAGGTLSAVNTYTGGTTVTDTSRVVGDTALGSGAVTIRNALLDITEDADFTTALTLDGGGYLRSHTSGGTTFSGGVAGTGNLTLGADVRLAGTNTYTGNTVIAGLRASLQPGALPGGSLVQLQTGGTLRADSSGVNALTLGTTAGTVSWTAGGFATAYGATSDARTTLTFNSGTDLLVGTTPGFLAANNSGRLEFSTGIGAGDLRITNHLDLQGYYAEIAGDTAGRPVEWAGNISNGVLRTSGLVQLTGNLTPSSIEIQSGTLYLPTGGIAGTHVRTYNGYLAGIGSAPVSWTTGSSAGQVSTASSLRLARSLDDSALASVVTVNGGATLVAAALALRDVDLTNDLSFSGNHLTVTSGGAHSQLSGKLGAGTLTLVGGTGTDLILTGTNSQTATQVGPGGVTFAAPAAAGASNATVQVGYQSFTAPVTATFGGAGGTYTQAFAVTDTNVTLRHAATDTVTLAGPVNAIRPFTLAGGTATAPLRLADLTMSDGYTLTIGPGFTTLNQTSGTFFTQVFDPAATLAGAATFAGNVILGAGATLSPGDGIGRLTFAGGLSFNSGALIALELGDPLGYAGEASDLLRVSGGALAGAGTDSSIRLALTAAPGFGIGTYTFIDTTGAGLSSIGATSFAISAAPRGYDYAITQAGNFFQLAVTASAVPEPAAAAAITGLLALGLAACRRRRVPLVCHASDAPPRTQPAANRRLRTSGHGARKSSPTPPMKRIRSLLPALLALFSADHLAAHNLGELKHAHLLVNDFSGQISFTVMKDNETRTPVGKVTVRYSRRNPITDPNDEQKFLGWSYNVEVDQTENPDPEYRIYSLYTLGLQGYLHTVDITTPNPAVKVTFMTGKNKSGLPIYHDVAPDPATDTIKIPQAANLAESSKWEDNIGFVQCLEPCVYNLVVNVVDRAFHGEINPASDRSSHNNVPPPLPPGSSDH